MIARSLLVLGGRSDIGIAVAHAFAAKGYAVRLAARDPAALERDVADLGTRHGIEATAHQFDALATKTLPKFIADLPELPDVVVCAVGVLGEQAADENDPARIAAVLRANFEGPATALTLFAERMATRGSGSLVGISSVAGERGRASNYVYGSAKAGFTAFLSGLRNRLAGKGVHVVTVLPGFVATRMIEGMTTPKPLTAQPKEVGDAIYRAVEKGLDVVFVRPIWRQIMRAIRVIPEGRFKKMKI